MTAVPKKLTTVRLAAAVYFLVAGGPYGLEELIQSSGYGGAILAILITPIVFSLPTALMVGELSTAIPEEGGYYAWVRRALGPSWGFCEAWLSLCASVFDMAIYPTLFLEYLARLVPALGAGPARLAAGGAMIAACTAWNVRGARSVGNASVVLSVALLSPFVVLAALAFGGAPLAPSSDPASGSSAIAGTAGLLAGLPIAMWNFMGWDNASTFAGEVERPQRTYPRALAIAVVALLATYLVPVLAAARTGLPLSAWSTGAWATAAEQVGGVWLARAIVIGGALCGIGMYNALLLSFSRLPAALARDGYLPAAFARENERGVPVLSVVVSSALYAAGLFFSFRRLVEIDLLFYGLALMLEFVALVILRVRAPDLPRPFRVPGGLAGAVLVGVGPTLLFCASFARELGEGSSHQSAVVAACAAAVLGGLAWFRRRAPAGNLPEARS